MSVVVAGIDAVGNTATTSVRAVLRKGPDAAVALREARPGADPREMRDCTRVLALLLCAMALVGSGCTDSPRAAVPDALGEGPAIVVPVGRVPAHALAAVRDRLETMGFPTTVRPRFTPGPDSFDAGRRQWTAEALFDEVGAATRLPTGNRTPMVIAVIPDDIYMSERPEWPWVFQLRAGGAGAVISTARIDPANFGLPADPDLVDRRLSAMVVRIVGTTRLGAQLVTDPTCANRETMYSVAEIDQMRPVLCNGP